MKKISIVCPCYNEEENIFDIYQAVKNEFNKERLSKYEFELIFIDNHSIDKTRDIIREVAKEDKRVKAIFNARNFGHIRSPYYGLANAPTGDAAILMASDFQDPPSMIADFVAGWEEGYKIVLGQKNRSKEGFIISTMRKIYYRLIKKMTTINHINQFTGFALYDKSFLEVLRKLNDPYPYFRGIIAELGFDYKAINFTQPKREKGKTKNNFDTLYDMALLGITSYSKRPLRLATKYGFIGLFLSIVGFITTITLRILTELKILTNSFFRHLTSINTIVIEVNVLVGAIILFFIGMLGEYINMINLRSMNRPLVIEEERINFDE